MTQFQSFLATNNNKFVEVVDPSNPNQCFDLVVAWTDYLKLPRSFPFMYAYQIYSGYGTQQAQYFDRISNGPNDVPKEGDIIVWSYYYNYGAGHTGICKSADLYSLQVFEQNDPTGTNSHVRSYTYSNILGWLRPKALSQSPNADEYVNVAKAATATLVNAVDTGLQVGDPAYKTKMAEVKTKLQAVITKI